MFKDLKVKTNPEVTTVCYFDYVGPSPNPPPAPSSIVTSAETSPAETTTILAGDSSSGENSNGATKETGGVVVGMDMSGAWLRKRSVNIEAFLGANGAGFMQRKFAAQMELKHTITMNPPAFTAVRVQEDGGPLHLDTTFTVCC